MRRLRIGGHGEGVFDDTAGRPAVGDSIWAARAPRCLISTGIAVVWSASVLSIPVIVRNFGHRGFLLSFLCLRVMPARGFGLKRAARVFAGGL